MKFKNLIKSSLFVLTILILSVSCTSKEEKIHNLIMDAHVQIIYGQHVEAMESLDQLEKLDENLAVIYFMRGNIFVSQRKYDEAMEQYDKAIELDEMYVDAYINRGRLWFYMGREDKRCEDYLKAESLGAKNLGEETKFCI